MSRHNFYLWLFFTLPVIYFLSLPIATGDLAVWVAHGKYLLTHGEILRHDIFSVLPTRALIYPVGTSLIYAFLYKHGGLVGVSLFHKLVLIALGGIWYKASLSKCSSPWNYPSLLIILISWYGSSLFWIDRPALLGMVPLVLSFIILSKPSELLMKDYIFLNLINVFWVNIHGSWILLLLMLCWRVINRTLILGIKVNWQQFVAIILILTSSLINPFGYKVFHYVFETTSISMNRKIDEWARHSFAGPYSQQTIIYFILFLNVIGFCFFLFRRDKQKLKEIIASPFTLLLLMGLQSVRNSALAFYVLIPFACEFLLKKGRRKEYREHHSTLNLILSLIIFAIGIAFLPTIKPSVSEFLPANKREVFSRSTPVIFAHFLNETADTSPVFNDWDYGSYLMLEQKHPIFIDTRNIIYSDESFKEFSDVCLAEANWSLILEKYKVKYVLLEKKQRTKLINQLLAAGWKIVLMNDETVLFEKRA